MDPLALGAALAVLVTVVLGAVALASAATSTAGNMARQRLQNLVGTSVLEQSAVGSPLREQQSGELPGLAQAFLGREWAAKTALDLSRADIRLRVSEYVTLRVALALLLCAVVFVLIPSRPVAMVMAVALAAVGYLAPALFLRYRKQKRLDKLESQLEEALTLISNSLRAGFGLLQSLELAAHSRPRNACPSPDNSPNRCSRRAEPTPGCSSTDAPTRFWSRWRARLPLPLVAAEARAATPSTTVTSTAMAAPSASGSMV